MSKNAVIKRNRLHGITDYRRVMNTPKNIPSHEEITSRARKIWESSGQIDGQDLNNWLQAERELLDAAAASLPNGESVADSSENGSQSSSTPPSVPPTPWPRDRGNQAQIHNSGKKGRNRP
jgi:hypothetical protein